MANGTPTTAPAASNAATTAAPELPLLQSKREYNKLYNYVNVFNQFLKRNGEVYRKVKAANPNLDSEISAAATSGGLSVDALNKVILKHKNEVGLENMSAKDLSEISHYAFQLGDREGEAWPSTQSVNKGYQDYFIKTREKQNSVATSKQEASTNLKAARKNNAKQGWKVFGSVMAFAGALGLTAGLLGAFGASVAGLVSAIGSATFGLSSGFALAGVLVAGFGGRLIFGGIKKMFSACRKLFQSVREKKRTAKNELKDAKAQFKEFNKKESAVNAQLGADSVCRAYPDARLENMLNGLNLSGQSLGRTLSPSELGLYANNFAPVSSQAVPQVIAPQALQNAMPQQPTVNPVQQQPVAQQPTANPVQPQQPVSQQPVASSAQPLAGTQRRPVQDMDTEEPAYAYRPSQGTPAREVENGPAGRTLNNQPLNNQPPIFDTPEDKSYLDEIYESVTNDGETLPLPAVKSRMVSELKNNSGLRYTDAQAEKIVDDYLYTKVSDKQNAENIEEVVPVTPETKPQTPAQSAGQGRAANQPVGVTPSAEKPSMENLQNRYNETINEINRLITTKDEMIDGKQFADAAISESRMRAVVDTLHIEKNEEFYNQRIARAEGLIKGLMSTGMANIEKEKIQVLQNNIAADKVALEVLKKAQSSGEFVQTEDQPGEFIRTQDEITMDNAEQVFDMLKQQAEQFYNEPENYGKTYGLEDARKFLGENGYEVGQTPEVVGMIQGHLDELYAEESSYGNIPFGYQNDLVKLRSLQHQILSDKADAQRKGDTARVALCDKKFAQVGARAAMIEEAQKKAQSNELNLENSPELEKEPPVGPNEKVIEEQGPNARGVETLEQPEEEEDEISKIKDLEVLGRRLARADAGLQTARLAGNKKNEEEYVKEANKIRAQIKKVEAENAKKQKKETPQVKEVEIDPEVARIMNINSQYALDENRFQEARQEMSQTIKKLGSEDRKRLIERCQYAMAKSYSGWSEVQKSNDPNFKLYNMIIGQTAKVLDVEIKEHINELMETFYNENNRYPDQKEVLAHLKKEGYPDDYIESIPDEKIRDNMRDGIINDIANDIVVDPNKDKYAAAMQAGVPVSISDVGERKQTIAENAKDEIEDIIGAGLDTPPTATAVKDDLFVSIGTTVTKLIGGAGKMLSASVISKKINGNKPENQRVKVAEVKAEINNQYIERELAKKFTAQSQNKILDDEDVYKAYESRGVSRKNVTAEQLDAMKLRAHSRFMAKSNTQQAVDRAVKAGKVGELKAEELSAKTGLAKEETKKIVEKAQTKEVRKQTKNIIKEAIDGKKAAALDVKEIAKKSGLNEEQAVKVVKQEQTRAAKQIMDKHFGKDLSDSPWKNVEHSVSVIRPEMEKMTGISRFDAVKMLNTKAAGRQIANEIQKQVAEGRKPSQIDVSNIKTEFEEFVEPKKLEAMADSAEKNARTKLFISKLENKYYTAEEKAQLVKLAQSEGLNYKRVNTAINGLNRRHEVSEQKETNKNKVDVAKDQDKVTQRILKQKEMGKVFTDKIITNIAIANNLDEKEVRSRVQKLGGKFKETPVKETPSKNAKQNKAKETISAGSAVETVDSYFEKGGKHLSSAQLDEMLKKTNDKKALSDLTAEDLKNAYPSLDDKTISETLDKAQKKSSTQKKKETTWVYGARAEDKEKSSVTAEEKKTPVEQSGAAEGESKKKPETKAKDNKNTTTNKKGKQLTIDIPDEGKLAENIERQKAKEEAEAQAKAEKAAAVRAEREAKKAEEDKRKAEEAEAKRKAKEEAKKEAEAEAKRKAEEEAKKEAEAEAKRKAEEKARKEAEGEAKRKAEEAAKKAAEEAEKKRKLESIKPNFSGYSRENLIKDQSTKAQSAPGIKLTTTNEEGKTIPSKQVGEKVKPMVEEFIKEQEHKAQPEVKRQLDKESFEVATQLRVNGVIPKSHVTKKVNDEAAKRVAAQPTVQQTTKDLEQQKKNAIKKAVKKVVEEAEPGAE